MLTTLSEKYCLALAFLLSGYPRVFSYLFRSQFAEIYAHSSGYLDLGLFPGF